MSIKHKKIFYINSRERIEGTDNDFTVQVILDSNVKYDSVCILSCSIPKSYYLVQDGYNSFTLTEDDVSVVITLPPGNYSRRTFQTVLKNTLNNNSVKGWTYDITYPSTGADTGKFTYSVSNNSSIQPIFSFSSSSTVYEQMGFDMNSTNVFNNDTLISSNILKFQVENNLFIASDLVASSMGKNILLSIPCTFPDYTDIHYETREIIAQSRPLSTNNNNVYRFTLINEDGIKMNLNGLNMTMTIMIYQKDDFFEMAKQYIKYKLIS